MEFESIDKYIHMTKLVQGVEVMFAGQPCLKITEGLDNSYNWTIYPLFAKITYGANIFEDVPYCFEYFDTLEQAIADGLSTLHEMGAFRGEVDLPEDTYAKSEVNESEEELDESLKDTIKRGIKNFKRGIQGWSDQDHLAGDSGPKGVRKRNKSYDDETTKSLHSSVAKLDSNKSSPSGLQKRILDREMKRRGLTENILDSILEDCRAYAIKHTTTLVEAHDLSVELYISVLSEDTDAKSVSAFDWKSNQNSTGKAEPVKKSRGKPTFGATVEEMKVRMRENMAAGKRPHTGFDRNEKLRILRSGAMEHPEFSGTHIKSAGRPHGTTKAAADEKKKAAASVFSMWSGLGKKVTK